jgi:hypothetical protein
VPRNSLDNPTNRSGHSKVRFDRKFTQRVGPLTVIPSLLMEMGVQPAEVLSVAGLHQARSTEWRTEFLSSRWGNYCTFLR